MFNKNECSNEVIFGIISFRKVRINASSCNTSFVCLWFIVPLQNFSLIWRRHHYRWRAANFDLCSALMAIEQLGFFSVLYLLWHGASVYNGHLWGPVTHTPIGKRLAVRLSIPVFKTSRGCDSNIQPSACGANALTHCATATVIHIYICLHHLIL